MLDIRFIRENQEKVKDAARKKHLDFNLDELLVVDERRRHLLKEVETLKAEQNKRSKGKPSETEREELKQSKIKIKELDKEVQEIMIRFNELMLMVPQIPSVDVPDGKDDTNNKEVRHWGDKPDFDFEPKDHMQIMENLGWVDFERGAKVSGFRGYFLKDKAVELSLSLWQFALKHLTKKGFIPLITPVLAREDNFKGTGWLPQNKNEVYSTQDDLFLIGTSEVSVMGLHQNEVLQEEDLPIKYAAFSPCFRSEAGSYGKDMKGLMRVHEFYKVEQIILCRADESESKKWHEEITQNAEEIMQVLKLPYRVVLNCAGDLGLGQVKKYDIEAWMPSQNTYRETHSSSMFYDFQTRRLNIRYREKATGKHKFAHSLNNTAIATPRILIPLVENFQDKNGLVNLPFDSF